MGTNRDQNAALNLVLSEPNAVPKSDAIRS